MRRCVTLIYGAFLALTPSYAGNRQVTYQGDISPLNITPTFDNGYLVVWDRNTDGAQDMKTISVYGPSGSKLYQTAIQVPGWKYVSLSNAAADTNGMVALVFKGGFTILNPDGKQVQTILTGRYTPTQVCFAPDHSIWIAGIDYSGAQYNVFRKYSGNGQLIGEFFPSRYPSGLHAALSIGGRALQSYSGGVVALLVPESTPASGAPQMQWIELSPDGQTVKQLGKHRYFFPWTLTPEGTIYAKEGARFVSFDRASATWKENATKRPGTLAGADQSGLVFLLPDRSTIEWVSPAQ